MQAHRRSFVIAAGVFGVLLLSGVGWAQLSDLTQTPNAANEGIHKSFAEEIGAGRGDVFTPESSLYIIARDPFRSVRRGRQIFQRKFRRAEGQGPRTQDGIGTPGTDPDIFEDASFVAGLADSCAACHGRPRGSAGFGGDVFTRPDSRDAPHLFGLGLQEMLADEITSDLRRIRDDAIARAAALRANVQADLRSKGIAYGFIRARPDGTVDTSGVRGVDADLRVKPFFAHGGTISIREFLVGAFNAEMGLEAPDPDLIAASGQDDETGTGIRVVTPSGMVLDGTQDDIEAAPVVSETQDGDGDGVVNEIPTSIVDHMEFYLLHYFKAGVGKQTAESSLGRIAFSQIGCTSCHIPNLTIARDRRVADVETNYDAQRGNPFNHMFAVAVPSFAQVNDGSELPTLKVPSGGPFVVRNFFADMKRHDLGKNFHELEFNNTFRTVFMTEPLWGVGTTVPYGHDGRSQNLEEVIQHEIELLGMHAGEVEGLLHGRTVRDERPAPEQQRAQALARSPVVDRDHAQGPQPPTKSHDPHHTPLATIPRSPSS
jgi:hypothetical protein